MPKKSNTNRVQHEAIRAKVQHESSATHKNVQHENGTTRTKCNTKRVQHEKSVT